MYGDKFSLDKLLFLTLIWDCKIFLAQLQVEAFSTQIL